MAKGEANLDDAIVTKMLSVFDRRVNISALDCLVHAIKVEANHSELAGSALALDANAILKIPGHKKSTDIIDYLGTHAGPLVLPGQVIQEFWNNQLAGVDTISKSIQKQYDALLSVVEKSEIVESESIAEIGDSLKKFREDNEVLFHPDTVRRTIVFLETLLPKAIVPFVPRLAFSETAVLRKRAKTPPGFKDQGDGDFLVWSDLLFGLLKQKRDGVPFSRVILVTNDGKIDWCREGVAHPILIAEARALLGIDFEIWTLERLVKAIG